MQKIQHSQDSKESKQMLRKSNYFDNAQFLCFTWQTQNDLQVLTHTKNQLFEESFIFAPNLHV